MARKLIVEIVGDASNLSRTLGTASAETEGFGSKAAGAAKGLAVLTAAGAAAGIAIGVSAAKMAVDFQSSMELLHTQAGVSQKAIASLSNSVLGMAGSVATAPDVLATGLYHLSSQGLKGAQAMEALKIAAEGAKVGQANLEDVTNALGAVLASGIKGSKNYSQAMGEMNATVGAGDMRMQDLADAMGTGLPAKAAIFGVSLKDISAGLAVFGDNNIRGAEAGTQLASAIRLMGAPSGAAAKALKGIGISSNELGDDLRSGGLVKAISDLKTHMEDMGLSSTKQADVLTKAFGGRQAGGILILLDQLERLKTKEKEVSEGASTFGKSWAATQQTTAFQMEALKTNVDVLSIKLGSALLPYVNDVVRSLNDLAAGNYAKVFEDLGFSAGTSAKIVADLTTVFDATKTAIGAVTDFVQSHWQLVTTATASLENAVRQHWGAIQAEVMEVVDIIRTTISAFVEVVEGIWNRFGSTLTDAVRTVWTFIKSTVQNDLEIVRGVIDVISGLIHGDWSKAWDGIKEIVSGVISQIGNILRTSVSLLGDAAKILGQALLAGLQWGGDQVLALMKALPGKIIAGLGNLGSLLEQAGEDLIMGFVHGIESKFDAVKSTLGNLTSKLTSWKGPPSYDVTILENSGQLVIQGFVNGLESKYQDVHKSLKDFGSSLSLDAELLQAARVIGLNQAESIASGFIAGTPTLAEQIKSALAQAMQQARQAIVEAKSSFNSAFSQLASGALSAFDQVTDAWVSPASKLLSKMQGEDQLTQLKQQLDDASSSVTQAQQALDAYNATAGGTPAQLQAVADATTKVKLAQDALTAAISKYGSGSDQAARAGLTLDTAQNGLAKAQAAVGVDPTQLAQLQQALTQAQQQYTSASRAIQEYDLQQKDVAQTAAYDKSRAKQRESLAGQLADLQTELAKQPGEYTKVNNQVIALMKKFEVPMFTAGQRIASQFADGLNSQLDAVTKAAKALAQAVSDHIKTSSPAKKGPLSVMSPFDMGAKIGLDFSTGLGSRLYAGAGLAATASALTGQTASAGQSGSGVYIAPGAIVVSGWVGNDQQLAGRLVDEVNARVRSNGPVFRAGAVIPN